MIERLTRLHIDGDPTVYPALAKEWERRGERWCGGGKSLHLPTMQAFVEHIRSLTPFNGWRYHVYNARAGEVHIEEAVEYPDSTYRSFFIVATFVLAIDGSPWLVRDDGASRQGFDPTQYTPCSATSTARAPSNMYDRTGLCRQPKRGTHNSRRQCCPIPSHRDQQPTPAEAL
jgi:hypothetical protein